MAGACGAVLAVVYPMTTSATGLFLGKAFVVCVIAAIAAWTARETHKVPMNDLGNIGLRRSVTAAV